MKVYKRNTFDLWPLEDKSVQAIITSPPYWGKRNYPIPDVIIGGDPKHEHVWVPASLKDSRSWKSPSMIERQNLTKDCNICECGAYYGQHGLEPYIQMYLDNFMIWVKEAWRCLKDDGILFINLDDTYGGSWGGSKDDPLFRRKSLLLIPDQVRVAMFKEGWYFRNKIPWEKSNGIPDSAGDRFAHRHEDIFFCTKKPDYYFDLDRVRVPYKPDSFRRFKDGYTPHNIPDSDMPGRSKPHQRSYKMHPLGANPGDVWRFSASKAPGLQHSAMFPEPLVDRMVKCSTKPGDTVVDPFAGSGTVLRVADSLSCNAIGFDLGYEDVRKQRLTEIQKEMAL